MAFKVKEKRNPAIFVFQNKAQQNMFAVQHKASSMRFKNLIKQGGAVFEKYFHFAACYTKKFTGTKKRFVRRLNRSFPHAGLLFLGCEPLYVRVTPFIASCRFFLGLQSFFSVLRRGSEFWSLTFQNFCCFRG
jgi:hypothetical protein